MPEDNFTETLDKIHDHTESYINKIKKSREKPKKEDIEKSKDVVSSLKDGIDAIRLKRCPK